MTRDYKVKGVFSSPKNGMPCTRFELDDNFFIPLTYFTWTGIHPKWNEVVRIPIYEQDRVLVSSNSFISLVFSFWVKLDHHAPIV